MLSTNWATTLLVTHGSKCAGPKEQHAAQFCVWLCWGGGSCICLISYEHTEAFHWGFKHPGRDIQDNLLAKLVADAAVGWETIEIINKHTCIWPFQIVWNPHSTKTGIWWGASRRKSQHPGGRARVHVDPTLARLNVTPHISLLRDVLSTPDSPGQGWLHQTTQ